MKSNFRWWLPLALSASSCRFGYDLSPVELTGAAAGQDGGGLATGGANSAATDGAAALGGSAVGGATGGMPTGGSGGAVMGGTGGGAAAMGGTGGGATAMGGTGGGAAAMGGTGGGATAMGGTGGGAAMGGAAMGGTGGGAAMGTCVGSLPTEVPGLAPMAGCPAGYLLVEASSAAFLGPVNTDFCVAKFEMRAVRSSNFILDADGSNAGAPLAVGQYFPESRSDGLPWQFISENQAETECASLGSGYHLITNDEWMTLASTIEAQSYNWNTCAQGQGGLFSGLNGRSAVSNLSDPYSDTGATSSDAYGLGGEKRRVFYLPNGERIWDLAGWSEWVAVVAQGNSVPLSVYAGDGNDSGLDLNFDFDTQAFLDLIFLSSDDPAMPPTYVAVRPSMVIPASAFNATTGLYAGATFAKGYGRLVAKHEFRDNKALMRGGDGVFGFNTFAYTVETNWETAFRCAKTLP